MAQDLVGRVKRLLLSPKSEWDAIDAESGEPQPIIMGYVAPLAAIPAIASVIGLAFIGVGAFGYTYKVPLASALLSGVLSFVFAIVGVFVFAAIINALAPNFGAAKNYRQAFKVAAYAPTAGWVAGVFTIVPMLGILALVGAIYSLYLLFVGLPKLMKPAAEKGTPYTIVAIVVALVVGIAFSILAQLFVPGPAEVELRRTGDLAPALVETVAFAPSAAAAFRM